MHNLESLDYFVVNYSLSREVTYSSGSHFNTTQIHF